MVNTKDNIKIVGDDTVTYWNLVRSYLLLHNPTGFAVFSSQGMNNCNDFLHYSYCHKFDTEEEMNEYFKELEDSDDMLAIRISNGNILD